MVNELSSRHRNVCYCRCSGHIGLPQERFGLKPNRLLGDGAYGNAELLGWMVDEKDIAPHVTLLDTPGRPISSFTQKDLTYDKTKDVFTCPSGKELRQFWREVNVNAEAYIAQSSRVRLFDEVR